MERTVETSVDQPTSTVLFGGCNYISLENIRMAGGDAVDESQFKGLSKYFNSHTNRGRANTAKATYAVFGAIILYFTLKPKSKK